MIKRECKNPKWVVVVTFQRMGEDYFTQYQFRYSNIVCACVSLLFQYSLKSRYEISTFKLFQMIR